MSMPLIIQLGSMIFVCFVIRTMPFSQIKEKWKKSCAYLTVGEVYLGGVEPRRKTIKSWLRWKPRPDGIKRQWALTVLRNLSSILQSLMLSIFCLSTFSYTFLPKQIIPPPPGKRQLEKERGKNSLCSIIWSLLKLLQLTIRIAQKKAPF